MPCCRVTKEGEKRATVIAMCNKICMCRDEEVGAEF